MHNGLDRAAGIGLVSHRKHIEAFALLLIIGVQDRLLLIYRHRLIELSSGTVPAGIPSDEKAVGYRLLIREVPGSQSVSIEYLLFLQNTAAVCLHKNDFAFSHHNGMLCRISLFTSGHSGRNHCRPSGQSFHPSVRDPGNRLIGTAP